MSRRALRRVPERPAKLQLLQAASEFRRDHPKAFNVIGAAALTATLLSGAFSKAHEIQDVGQLNSAGIIATRFSCKLTDISALQVGTQYLGPNWKETQTRLKATLAVSDKPHAIKPVEAYQWDQRIQWDTPLFKAAATRPGKSFDESPVVKLHLADPVGVNAARPVMDSTVDYFALPGASERVSIQIEQHVTSHGAAGQDYELFSAIPCGDVERVPGTDTWRIVPGSDVPPPQVQSFIVPR